MVAVSKSSTSPPYKAKAIANHFLGLGEKDGIPLSQMKLQKLIYFAHGWYLGLMQEPLIDERIQAWQFGPVIRTVYDEFKGYGKDPVTSRAESVEMHGSNIRFFDPDVPESDKQTRELLDRVWEVYKNFSAYQLSTMTHRSDSPWEKAYSENPGVRNLTIEDDDIRTFFETMANANRQRKATA